MVEVAGWDDEKVRERFVRADGTEIMYSSIRRIYLRRMMYQSGNYKTM